MNKYIIIKADTAEKLAEEVTSRINMPGWYISGGHAVTVIRPAAGDIPAWIVYSQAMVFDGSHLERVLREGAQKHNHRHSQQQPVSVLQTEAKA